MKQLVESLRWTSQRYHEKSRSEWCKCPLFRSIVVRSEKRRNSTLFHWRQWQRRLHFSLLSIIRRSTSTIAQPSSLSPRPFWPRQRPDESDHFVWNCHVVLLRKDSLLLFPFFFWCFFAWWEKNDSQQCTEDQTRMTTQDNRCLNSD